MHFWDMSALMRVVVTTTLGLVAGAVIAWFAPWQLTGIAAWDVAAASLLACVWLSVARLSPADTQKLAMKEDDRRVGAHVVLARSPASIGCC